MTDHPCKGMCAEQVAAFEQIAVGAVPQCLWPDLDALLAAGVIARGEDIPRRDSMGAYVSVHFYVPVSVHAQWCAWCAEQQPRGVKYDKTC